VPASGPAHPRLSDTSAIDDTTDVAALLAAVARGDDAAWEVVVARYRRLLGHICRQHRMTPDQTEDILQTTWLVLLRHAGDIRNAAALPGWLITTATRECLALRRRNAREVPTHDCGYDVADAVVDAEVDDRLDALPHLRQLRRTVATLPPRERRLMELMLEPELPSYLEISHRLGMPVGAIGPVRRRAMDHLRDRLTAPVSGAAAAASA
jgi:RNA polymerase sigma factor (sigma-70 family)